MSGHSAQLISKLPLLKFIAAGSIVFLCLAGCAQPGDFGRPKANALSRITSPLDGPTNSGFPFTDDEQELRERAWRFLMPAQERWIIDRIVYDAARNGYLPVEYFPETLTWYHEALMSGPFRSPASRYAQIASDVASDRQMLSAFAHMAARVTRTDISRAKAVPAVNDLTVAEWSNASIRMQENRALIGWVCYRASMRLHAYRYALEHNYIAMPQMEAIKTERVLLGYENDFEPLRAGSCIRHDPWRDLRSDNGLRIPKDGHFFPDEGGVVPSRVPTSVPQPARIRKY